MQNILLFFALPCLLVAPWVWLSSLISKARRDGLDNRALRAASVFRLASGLVVAVAFSVWATLPLLGTLGLRATGRFASALSLAWVLSELVLPLALVVLGIGSLAFAFLVLRTLHSGSVPHPTPE